MSRLNEILEFNQKFVEDETYLSYETDKYPNKRMVIVTCMDTRLIELLPKAMNIKNGDAKIIKIAGALITEPYGSVMRSLLVAISLLNAEEVYIVGHHHCGMIGLHTEQIVEALALKGVSRENVDQLEKTEYVDLQNWLTGANSVEEAVKKSISMIQSHPLFPRSIPIHGLAIDPHTGKLDLLVDGQK
ncbi:carbonic anhydrase [Seinonella peptonophila]|uniref:carbonic anhydrase n=1 Tax=Seinonella peptonophila TaxID=112248 RepID=A0A1M4V5E8_9BACL|nr:carbonic anhydrase [Seinonella peptonophila]SHE64127.1 carbonic anhydrase [Seinonella peptonophila]